MKAVIYTRPIETPTVPIHENSARQCTLCTEFADELGYDVIGRHSDVNVGSALFDRPGLWTALNSMPQNASLIVYHRDVLSSLDYLAIVINMAVEKQGNRIETVTGGIAGTSAEARLVHRVLATVAEYEQKCIRARTRHAFLRNQDEGIRAGRYAPYGWKIDTASGTKSNKVPKQMIRNIKEESAIREIIRRRVEDAQGYYDIATALNGSDEFKAIARHGTWNAKAIRKICERYDCSTHQSS